MARLAVFCTVALVALGCGGDGGSDAVGELMLAGTDGVYGVDLESGEERPIGSVAQYGGSWSPSGTKVASFQDDTMRVTTVATGARERVDAPPCWDAVWSPDETAVACEHGEWVISTLDLATGETRTLTEWSARGGSFTPAWSPDSRSIAYMTHRALVVMRRDGSGKHRVATGGTEQALDRGPAWSPDGRRIAYLAGSSVRIVNAGGGNDRLLLDGAGRATLGLAWSPDGRFIAVTHEDGDDFEIFVLDVASGEARNVTDNTGVDDRKPVWAPDGRHVAYLRSDRNSHGVYVVSVDGGEPSHVFDNAEAILHWSPASQTG